MSFVSVNITLKIKMTEEKIFGNLLKKDYDYPKLHSEAADTIAGSFTNFIYDNLKLKSTTTVTDKRLNVLKFIHFLVSRPENHLEINETNYPIFINSFKDTFIESSNQDDFINLCNEIDTEELPGDLCLEVQQFYKRKNHKHRDKIKKLELIKKYDQESLDRANFPLKVTKQVSYYETNENIIKNLLLNEKVPDESNSVISVVYREKQIKFAYAMFNLKNYEILEKLLKRLTNYKQLESFEINFLNYFNEFLNSDGEYLRQYLLKNFMFIYESCIVRLCTQLIQIEDENVPQFFVSLSSDKKMFIVKKLCQNQLFKLKLTSLIFELYSYSFCNCNLLKFMDFLIN